MTVVEGSLYTYRRTFLRLMKTASSLTAERTPTAVRLPPRTDTRAPSERWRTVVRLVPCVWLTAAPPPDDWRVAAVPPSRWPALPCPSRKLYPRVAMVQSAEDWCGHDGSGSLHGSSQRRVLAQPQMRARLIVIKRVRRQNPSQMTFAYDQDVIQAVTAEGTDQAFNICILPRRSR